VGQKATDVDPVKIERWIVVYFAVLTGRSSEAIDLDQPLADFDLDSVDAVELTSEFEKAFGHELDPEFFLRGGRSLREVVAGLAEVVEAK
jgi:acyl carrier protein